MICRRLSLCVTETMILYVVISTEVEETDGTDLFVTAERSEAAEIIVTTVMIVMTVVIVMIVAVVAVAVMSWYADVGKDNKLKH